MIQSETSTKQLESRKFRGAFNMKSGIVAVRNVIAVLLLLPLSLPRQVSAQLVAVDSRKIAPAFSLPGVTKIPIRLSDYRGRVVLLNFWATWCHGCKTEIPWYVEFQDKWNSRGLAVIGASMDDDGWKAVKPFVKEKKINYPMVIANDSLARQYGLKEMPLSVLIDRQGRIADSHSGVVDPHAWETEILSLLNEEQQGAH